MSAQTPSINALKKCLLDISEPIAKRTRAVFYLRTRGKKEDLEVLLQAVKNVEDSDLMRHEIAYVIGQFQDSEACETLISIVNDASDDCMVRHEAAEALGAIGHPLAIEVLEKYSNDPSVEVAETCQLALELIQWRQLKGSPSYVEGDHDENPYLSVDPAPAAEKWISTMKLKQTLLDESLPLFKRYRAMFSLRNRNSPEAALALSEAFSAKSALFRHEIAYVMGQMENPVTIPALKKIMEDKNEHRMVRHEAAEALGAIGTPECEQLLKKFRDDDQQVVRESCEVALDAMDYWSSEY